MCFSTIFGDNCGTISFNENIDPPHNYPELPKRMICPKCGKKRKVVYRALKTKFTFCFIPIYTKRKEIPFVACYRCNFKLSSSDFSICPCGEATASTGNFCPYCGQINNVFNVVSADTKAGNALKEYNMKKIVEDPVLVDYINEEENMINKHQINE